MRSAVRCAALHAALQASLVPTKRSASGATERKAGNASLLTVYTHGSIRGAPIAAGSIGRATVAEADGRVTQTLTTCILWAFKWAKARRAVPATTEAGHTITRRLAGLIDGAWWAGAATV